MEKTRKEIPCLLSGANYETLSLKTHESCAAGLTVWNHHMMIKKCLFGWHLFSSTLSIQWGSVFSWVLKSSTQLPPGLASKGQPAAKVSTPGKQRQQSMYPFEIPWEVTCAATFQNVAKKVKSAWCRKPLDYTSTKRKCKKFKLAHCLDPSWGQWISKYVTSLDINWVSHLWACSLIKKCHQTGHPNPSNKKREASCPVRARFGHIDRRCAAENCTQKNTWVSSPN